MATTSVCSTVTALAKKAISYPPLLEQTTVIGSLQFVFIRPFFQKRFFVLRRIADIHFNGGEFFFQPEFQLTRQVFLDVKSVFRIGIGQIFVVWVRGDVIFIR